MRPSTRAHCSSEWKLKNFPENEKAVCAAKNFISCELPGTIFTASLTLPS